MGNILLPVLKAFPSGVRACALTFDSAEVQIVTLSPCLKILKVKEKKRQKGKKGEIKGTGPWADAFPPIKGAAAAAGAFK